MQISYLKVAKFMQNLQNVINLERWYGSKTWWVVATWSEEVQVYVRLLGGLTPQGEGPRSGQI